LNRRYLKISDTLLFADGQVKFDIIPKYYFSSLSDDVYNLAFVQSMDLERFINLEEISPLFKLDEEKLLKCINKENKKNFRRISEIKQFVNDERTVRFDKLIDERFTNDNLIRILELFKNRKGPDGDKPI